jgi:hypothetical protein
MVTIVPTVELGLGLPVLSTVPPIVQENYEGGPL